MARRRGGALRRHVGAGGRRFASSRHHRLPCRREGQVVLPGRKRSGTGRQRTRTDGGRDLAVGDGCTRLGHGVTGVNITLLCEDLQTEVFVRRFLKHRNFRSRDIRTLPLPGGRQSGEQWVRERYPTETTSHSQAAGRLPDCHNGRGYPCDGGPTCAVGYGVRRKGDPEKRRRPIRFS